MSAEASLLSAIDVTQLLEARLWVARLGETDVNSWWRTDGILGPDGAFVGPRVLPVTHPTARARIAFAVASHSCSERHPDRNTCHLFKLTPEIEDRLDQLLVDRLGDRDFWSKRMAALEAIGKDSDTADVLRTAGVVEGADLSYVQKLQLGPAERSLPIGRHSAPETVRRLAAGFIRSRPGSLAVPIITNGN